MRAWYWMTDLLISRPCIARLQILLKKRSTPSNLYCDLTKSLHLFKRPEVFSFFYPYSSCKRRKKGMQCRDGDVYFKTAYLVTSKTWGWNRSEKLFCFRSLFSSSYILCPYKTCVSCSFRIHQSTCQPVPATAQSGFLRNIS